MSGGGPKEFAKQLGRRRFELSTLGFDVAKIGLSTDPWNQPGSGGSGFTQSTGLRIPAVLPSDSGPATRPRYLFLLASRVIDTNCKLIGIRQGLTIGNFLNADAPNLYSLEMFVTTPTWSFVDGNVSWHLVEEDNVQESTHRPAITDAASWAQDVTDTPAMLYRTFANTNVNPNGAPVDYAVGLTAYTPPMLHNGWRPIAGLKCFYDIRFPWQSETAYTAFGEGISLNVGRRVSLYASVLQTNPAARLDSVPAIGSAGPPSTQQAPYGLPPEEAFLTLMAAFNGGGEEEPNLDAQYARVMGSLIFEDEVEVGVRG